MKEKILKRFQSLRDFWHGASKKLRVGILASIAVLLAVSLVTALMLNRKEYVLLYNSLSNAESARVLTVLQEMGVETNVAPNGSISVLEKDENRARMRLATEGLPGTNFNYDTLKEGSGLTATQFEKNQWQINQIQERLAGMIMTMEEVQQAVVTISMPPGSTFTLQKDNEPATAAVMLVKVPGKELSPKQLKGIVSLVKNSVRGLKEENITIADETGELSIDGAQEMQGSDNKLELTEKVSESIKKRALSVLEPIYGSQHVEVAANCVLDTNNQTTERTTYLPIDPENPTDNPLDYAEYLRDKDGEGFGPAEGVPGANDNVQTPQYAAMEDEAEGATYFSGHDVYDYLVGSERDQIIKNGLELVDATVAVIIDTASLPDGQRDQIFDTVSRATGIPVENISVQNYAFNQPNALDTPLGQPIDTRRIVVLSALILAGLILIVIVVAMLVSRHRRKALEGGLDDDTDLLDYDEYDDMDLDGEGTSTLVDLLQNDEVDPIVMVETQEQKLKAQIKNLADTDPEIVAQLLKTWLSP